MAQRGCRQVAPVEGNGELSEREAEAMGQGPCFLWLDGGHWGQERQGHGNRRVLRKTKDASPGMSFTPRAMGSLDFGRHKECLGFGVEEGMQGRQENGSSSRVRGVSCPYTGQDGPKLTLWVPRVVSSESSNNNLMRSVITQARLPARVSTLLVVTHHPSSQPMSNA